MQTFEEATENLEQKMDGSKVFKFGDGYELWFEKLIWDNQYYVALYDKNLNLLTDKIVIKPGYENENPSNLK